MHGRSSKARKAALRRRREVASWWPVWGIWQDCCLFRGKRYTGLEIHRDRILFTEQGVVRRKLQ